MKQHRTGTTVMEMTVAIVLLLAAVSATTQLIGAAMTDRRRTDRRQLARYEVANLMERVAVLPWTEVTNENLQAWPLADELQQQLPHVRLQALVEQVAAGGADTPKNKPPPLTVRARKITLAIFWGGPEKSHVRLISWRYAPPPKDAAPKDAAPPKAEPKGEDS